MKNIITIALLLSFPVMASAGELFPSQPAPMSPGYGQNGSGVHAAKPEGVPNEACIINPVSMSSGVREITVSEMVAGDEFSIPTTLLFDFDGDRVRPKGMDDLIGVYNILVKGGAKTLKVTGHTDSKGTEAYNMDLGLRRATAVGNVLKLYGYEDVEVASAGESEPLVPNEVDGVDSPENRQQNRRVVIEVLEVEQKEVTRVETERFPRNPQVFHVMSSDHRVSCAGTATGSRIFGTGLFIYNGYYPSYQIYGNGQFLR